MNLSDILSERLVYALGWTILHSFWQSALIAILLGLLMIVMRNYSSQSRYFVSASALVTIFVLAVVTYITYYGQYKPHVPSDFTLQLPVAPPVTDGQASSETFVQASTWQTVWANTEAYFRQHLPLLVSVWLLGITFLLLRFIGGYAYLQRLKNYQVQTVNEYWQGTLAYLSTEIGIKRKVRLLESALAEMPMVIGWLKPVILLPIGTLSGLSISQVESILAHELAHLKRNDYIVNMIQSMLEIVLFYNPFVWWVSGYIRQERENCCDDIAVGLTGDSMTLVKTLTMLEELRVMKPQLAMGFAGGTRGGLLSRVRRLLVPKRKASGFSEGFLSAMVLVFCLSITTVNAYTPYNWHNLQDLATKSWEKIQKVANIFTKNAYTASVIEKEADILPAQASVLPAEQRERFPILKPLRRLDINDTIRFGQGYMAITDRKGSVKMYKEGKEIPKEEFEKYKSEFSIAQTPHKDYTASHYYLVAPPAPPAPPVAPKGFMIFNPDIWEDVEVEINGKKTKRKVKKKSTAPRTIIINPNGTEGLDWEQYGRQWEQYGRQWGQWGEQFGKQWGQWGEEFGKNAEKLPKKRLEKLKKELKKLSKEAKKLSKEQVEILMPYEIEVDAVEEAHIAHEEALEAHKEALEAHEEAREAHEEALKAHEEARERHNETHDMHENIDKNINIVKEAIIKDGLMQPDAKSFDIASTENSLTINGKKLTPEQEAKYRKLLAETIGAGMSKKTKWSWSWSK